MIVSRKVQSLIATCILASFVAYAEHSKLPKRQLKFEVSTIPVEMDWPFAEVKHIGYFHVKEDRSLPSWRYSLWETSQWKDMSEEQRQFINKLSDDYQYKRYVRNKRIGSPFSINSQNVRTPEGTRTYQVLGVSEENVRKMARAVIETLDKKAHEAIETNKKLLETNLESIEEAEKTLPRFETEVKRLEVQANEKIVEYSEANYGIDSKEMIREHARKTMEDLAHHVRLVDFELIGLQAKIDSISRFKANEKITNQDTLTKLDQMLITIEIERAGILARRNAYMLAFKQAKGLHAIIILLLIEKSRIFQSESILCPINSVYEGLYVVKRKHS